MLMLPILEIAADGRQHSVKSAISELTKRFDLSSTERAKRTPSGQQRVFDNRVAWSITYLKMAGLIDRPVRGSYRLAPKGLEILRAKPEQVNVHFLEQFPQFTKFKAKRRGMEQFRRDGRRADTQAKLAPKGSVVKATDGLMSDQEIDNAIAALRTLFDFTRQLRKIPGGRVATYPKLSSSLSESIVAREIREGRAPVWGRDVKLSRGGREADLLVSFGNRTDRVEVKATGRQGFQYLGPKDVAADVLVWLHFGAYFESDKFDPLEAYWLEKPAKVFDSPRKIALSDFKKKCQGKLQITRVDPKLR